jgi:glutamate-1-semialdehyde aminotransferase
VGPFDNIRAADLAPLCASWADGARYFDRDGHDYVDLVGAALPFVLGHLHVDVDRAVRSLLHCGISPSCHGDDRRFKRKQTIRPLDTTSRA